MYVPHRLSVVLAGLFLAVCAFPAAAFSAEPPLPVVARTVEVPPISLEWYEPIFGSGIGSRGLVVADLDDDGDREIVLTSEDDYWMVLEHREGAYVQRWASPSYTSSLTLTEIVVVQADSDAALEILVGTSGQIQIYDGATLELERVIPLTGSVLKALAVGDVDADGQTEVVYASSADLVVHDLATGAEERRKSGFGGVDVAVGQADDDAALEIAVANGSLTGSVIDGATGMTEFGVGTGFGSWVAFGDLDGDTKDELVAGFPWAGIDVYDVDTDSLAYEVSTGNLAAIVTADVDGDHEVELLYGEAQWGSIHVLNGSDGVEEYEVDNPEHGVTRIAVGDVDTDSAKEILWGAGYTSSGADHLYVVDSATRLTEWTSLDLRGPFLGIDHGDIDGDGEPELLTASFESDSGYDDGLYRIYDAVTKELEFTSPPSTGSAWTGLWAARTADVDDDPQGEVCITSSQTYSGKIFCYDGLTHDVEWEVTIDSGLAFNSLVIADATGDGIAEVVAGTGQEHTGAPGFYIYAYAAETGYLTWRSPDLGLGGFPFLPHLRVAEVDGDPTPEVIGGVHGGELVILDGATGAVQLTTADLGVTALTTRDSDGNGIEEIVIATEANTVVVVDAVTGLVTSTLRTEDRGITSLAFADVNRDGVEDLFYGTEPLEHFGTPSYLLLADGATGAILWVSQSLPDNPGLYDSLLVADTDRDGNQEVMVGTRSGVALFEIVRLTELFSDGFESGDVSAWSTSMP